MAVIADEQRTIGDRRRVDRQQPRSGEPQGQLPPPGRRNEWIGQYSFGSLPLAYVRISRSAGGQNGVARKPFVLSTSIVTESLLVPAQVPGS
jgi:hypothetical protein